MKVRESLQNKDRLIDRSKAKNALAYLALMLCLSSTTASTGDHEGALHSEELIEKVREEFSPEPTWVQDFSETDTTILDESVWTYDTRPEVPTWNDEEQAYTDKPENIRIEPGVGLIITARREQYSYDHPSNPRVYEYTSARINSKESFSAEYGRFEAEVMFPSGSGAWAALWVLSANKVHSTRIAASGAQRDESREYLADGELDIVEFYGGRPGEVKSTLHTYNSSVSGTLSVENATEEFHTFAVEMTPKSIIWLIDDEPVQVIERLSDDTDDWPFAGGNAFYPILNLAIDETAGDIDPSQEAWEFIVRRVAYYDYVGAS